MPRKSPDLSRLANSASRTSLTICDDSEAERPAMNGSPERAMSSVWVFTAVFSLFPSLALESYRKTER